VDKDIEPEEVYSHIKELLQSEDFKIESEDVKDGFWDIHARKSSAERIIMGKIRDVDVVVAGTRSKFEVQLRAGIWGRDLAVPVVEGVATLGLATAMEVHSAHQFEEKMWEQIVRKIDPSLRICRLDGLLFKSDDELNKHIKMHEQQEMQQQAAQNSAMDQMLMWGTIGGMGMGMGWYGMGWGGQGRWI
jgi:hypothetical protein